MASTYVDGSRMVTHGRTGKGLSTLLASVLVVVGISACGSGAPADVRQDSGAPLQIWVRKPPGSATEQTAKDLAAKFTQKTGIQASVTALFDDFETKLQQAASRKQLPDIVINDTAH